MNHRIATFACLSLLLAPLSASSSVDYALELGAFSFAEELAQRGLANNPDDLQLQKNALKALSLLGKKEELRERWHQLLKQSPEAACDEQLLEVLAWSEIQHAARQWQPQLRMVSVLAAARARDRRSLPLLQRALVDRDAQVRALAAKVSPALPLADLGKTLSKQLSREPLAAVRRESLAALGHFHTEYSEAALRAILEGESRNNEEEAVAATSLLTLTEELSGEELVFLSASNHSGLRILAAKALGLLQVERQQELLYALAQDPLVAVRCEAWFSLSLIGHELPETLLEGAYRDNNIYVRILAARCALRNGDLRATEVMHTALSGHRETQRRFAAAALATCGVAAEPLLQEACAHDDLWVRGNAALGFVGLRKQLPQALSCLEEALDSPAPLVYQPLWNIPLLQPAGKHKLGGKAAEINFVTRLTLLRELALLDAPRATRQLYPLLQNLRWGDLSRAGLLLLQEGDQEACRNLQELVHTTEGQEQLQLALLFCHWGRDSKAAALLRQRYPDLPPRLKGAVLEAVAHVGDRASLPFLAEVLVDSAPLLRVIAAAGIIEAIYG